MPLKPRQFTEGFAIQTSLELAQNAAAGRLSLGKDARRLLPGNFFWVTIRAVDMRVSDLCNNRLRSSADITPSLSTAAKGAAIPLNKFASRQPSAAIRPVAKQLIRQKPQLRLFVLPLLISIC